MPDELFPPEDLLRALHSPFREVRLGAIRELSGPDWLHHQDPVRASAARRQLEWRAGLEDDQTVKGAIYGHLGGHRAHGGQDSAAGGAGRAPPGPLAGRHRRRLRRVRRDARDRGADRRARPGSPARPTPSPSRSRPAHVKPVRARRAGARRPSGQPLAASPDGQSVHAVAFSPAGDFLATGESAGAANGMTYLWNVASRQVTARLADTADPGRQLHPGRHRDRVQPRTAPGSPRRTRTGTSTCGTPAASPSSPRCTTTAPITASAPSRSARTASTSPPGTATATCTSGAPPAAPASPTRAIPAASPRSPPWRSAPTAGCSPPGTPAAAPTCGTRTPWQRRARREPGCQGRPGRLAARRAARA